jgi:hypothetical protein
MATPDEIRRAREQSSIFSNLFDYVRANEAQLASEGRRPVLGGLLSKEPVMGTDTIRYEGFGPMLAGLLEPLARGVDAPRAAAQGLIPQEDMIGEAFGTAGTVMGGTTAAAGRGAFDYDPTTTRIFAGPKAMGLGDQERALLEKAQAMFAAGESNSRVFNETGWFKGADGQLRFEINDQAASVINPDATTLGGLLDHPELFRLYPNMENQPVSVEQLREGSLGSYNPRTMQIKLQQDTPENLKSPLLHEVQHALQDIEGFSSGSTPSDNYSQQQAKRFADNILQNENAAKSRQAFYDTQGASAELSPLYTAKYIDSLDALTERALDGRAKPRDITRLGEWYRWGDEIRSNLGPMPKKPSTERDYWIASAARQLRDKELEGLGEYERLSYEDVLNRFETPKDRANAIKRIERRRSKTAPAAREYYLLTKRAKEAQQLEAIDAYLQNAGEVEARNVQTRLDPEKSKLFPWATQDYDYNQQIVDTFRPSDDPSNIFLSMSQKPLGIEILEQQARGNEGLGNLFKSQGMNIDDLGAADPMAVQGVLDMAQKRGILDPRSVFSLKRGLLD